ncbi:MAG: VanZ family protein [Fidelibacterota bacterium]
MRKHLFKLPAILYSILIFYLSSLPQRQLPQVPIFGFDKILHILEYLVYGLTLMLAFTNAKKNFFRAHALFVSAFVGFLYAASDEFHQLYVAGRDCTWSDFFADAFGLILGIYLYKKLMRYDNSGDGIIYQKTSHK